MGCCSAKKIADGRYNPSSFALSVATKSKSDYTPQTYATKYEGDKPVLVVCTDEGLMKMANGKVFNTGNHPMEVRLLTRSR